MSSLELSQTWCTPQRGAALPPDSGARWETRVASCTPALVAPAAGPRQQRHTDSSSPSPLTPAYATLTHSFILSTNS